MRNNILMREFRWNHWNLDHATPHGVSVQEIEALVRRGPARDIGDGRFLVHGRGVGGRFIRAIYIVGADEMFYVIHARPLTEREKRRYRRSKR